MYTGRTLFSQVMDFVPWTSFNRIVAKYRGDRDTRTLRCTEHFRVMAFAQVTYRESLRDIEACLGAQPAKLCSMGLRGPVAKSTLADANELRDWRIWSDLAAVLIKRARKLYLKDDFGLDLAMRGRLRSSSRRPPHRCRLQRMLQSGQFQSMSLCRSGPLQRAASPAVPTEAGSEEGCRRRSGLQHAARLRS